MELIRPFPQFSFMALKASYIQRLMGFYYPSWPVSMTVIESMANNFDPFFLKDPEPSSWGPDDTLLSSSGHCRFIFGV